MSENAVKTCTIFESWAMVAETLSDEQKGRYYHAIIRYALYGEEPELESPLNAFFALIQPVIDKSNNRKIAGAKGGSKLKQNASKTQAKRKQIESKIKAEEKAKVKQTASEEEEEEEEEVQEYNSLTRVIACASEEIAKIYPKEKIGNFRQVVEAIAKAVQREMDRGSSVHDAVALVKLGTIAYAGACSRMKHKRYMMQAVKFFDDGIYNNDPETWDFSEENNKKGGKDDSSYEYTSKLG
jgi:hypothetical protein